VGEARPLFETDGSRRDEEAIAESLQAAWKCSLIKLPISYKLDWMALRDGDAVAWVEAKRRFRELRQHPTVFFSLQKAIAARELHAVSGLPCFFVAQFNDCLAFVDVLPRAHRRIEFRGRIDRDGRDQEAVVVIPVNEWEIIRCG
jgi:hypothetical protein